MNWRFTFFSGGVISVIALRMMFLDDKEPVEVAITTVSLIVLYIIFMLLYEAIIKSGKDNQ